MDNMEPLLDETYRNQTPVSPWRARAKDFSRRSFAIRRLAILAASLAFGVPLFLLIYYSRNDSPIWVPAETTLPPQPPNVDLPVHHYDPPPANPLNPSADQAVPSKPDHPVTFSFIMWSESSANEGAILIKSILMYMSTPVEFHIICDESAQNYLERRLSLVKHPRHDVLVRFYRPTWAQMTGRIDREGGITTDHSAGVPGLMKLFIHEILPDTIKRSIFVDTDAFFISDPHLLWQRFDSFNASTGISMPTHMEQSAPEWHHANRICSCIMLLDLEKLREVRLMDSSIYRNDTAGPEASSPPAFGAMFGPLGPTGHYQGVKLGDQGYWWAIVSYRQELFEHLSFDWEVSSCLLDMYMTGLGQDAATESEELDTQIHTYGTVHEGQVVLPKLVHFNCLDGAVNYYDWPGWSDRENSLTKRWGATVAYHVGTKWLWLNQEQNNKTSLRMETVHDVQFADEIFAARQIAANVL